MHQEITYEWTPDFIKRITRQFIFRYAGSTLFGFLALFVIAVTSLLYGQAQGFVWFFVVAPLVVYGMWFQYYLRAIDACMKLTDRKVTLRLEDETLSFFMPDCNSTMKWSVIKKVWVFPDALLVFIQDDQKFSPIPTASLNEETKLFIMDKVKANGGKVS